MTLMVQDLSNPMLAQVSARAAGGPRRHDHGGRVQRHAVLPGGIAARGGRPSRAVPAPRRPARPLRRFAGPASVIASTRSSAASGPRVFESIDVDKRVGIEQCQAKLLERAAPGKELGHHALFGGVGCAAEHATACAIDLPGDVGPGQRGDAGSQRGGESWASRLFKRESAWGAIVVTGRAGQLALVSGRSKTSKKGYRRLRLTNT